MNRRSLLNALALSFAGVGVLSVQCGGSKSSASKSDAGMGSTGPGSDGGGTIMTGSSSGAGIDDAASGGDGAADDADSSGMTVVSGDGGTGGSQSVLQRGNDVFRRATYVESGLSAGLVHMMAPDATFNGNATFSNMGMSTNQGTASVLYLQDGPAAAGCPAGATGCQATTRAAGMGLFFAFPAQQASPNVVAFVRQ